MKKTSLVALLVALTLVAAGCGKSNKVGSDDLTNFQEGTTSPTRLGQTTTTAPAETTTTAAGTATTKAPPTTAKEAPFNTIEINLNYPHMKPPVAEAVAGKSVLWKNLDSVPRGIESNDPGLFSSPGLIAPGGTWEWSIPKTFASGNYNYHDSTRDYAVGTLSIAPAK